MPEDSPTEQGYSYTRQDGTVEHANSIEDVIARCRVIAEIAINDPDAVSDILELHAIGSQKIAEAKEQNSIRLEKNEDTQTETRSFLKLVAKLDIANKSERELPEQFDADIQANPSELVTVVKNQPVDPIVEATETIFVSPMTEDYETNKHVEHMYKLNTHEHSYL